MKKLIYILAIGLTICSCGNNKKSEQCAYTDSLKQEVKKESLLIEGAWLQPIPGQAGMQGFDLKKNGEASSINMSTLLYKSWKLSSADSMLTLISESIGNGQTIMDTTIYKIVKLKNDSLVIKSSNNAEETYVAKK